MVVKIKKFLFKYKLFLIIIIPLFLLFFFLSFFYKLDIEDIKDSVVMIEVYDDNNQLLGTGSGFCAYKSDYIITNFHVIEGGYNIKIITDDKKSYDVNKILIFDKENDLAILKANVDLKPLKFSNIKKAKAGHKVTAIGSPKGQLNTVSTGVISNADEDKYLRITAPISPGSSGGVLLDKKNRVLGVTSATYNSEDAQNINYAISLKYVEKMYKSYKKEEYYIVKDTELDGCMNNSNNIISFNSCTKSKYNYYSSHDFDTFYKITNPVNRYDYSMKIGDWNDVYKTFMYSDKELATAYYEELINTNFCYDDCDIVNDIKDWSTAQFIINLEVLNKEELSFVLADLENYVSDNDKFYRVEEYPLEAYQKTLILYLIGDRSWSNIHTDNKRDVFDYFDSNYGTDDLGAILEILGYNVVYENDGTLTAYW